ncbi:PTS system mannose/fructose/sorbose family transporter subunit IID, partial [Eubacteriales bacterium OttesenSCG-928-M02]|nr:PTS system mannose/fructose/sorbose family transporter subunit IID [Eubacteriales bacterium OttesenSCG-928-M02]
MTNTTTQRYTELYDTGLYWKTYIRYTILASCCFSQVKMMTVGFTIGILPWFRRLYPDRGERFTEALVRHQAFFNCTPETAYFILGLIMSMEGEYHDAPDSFDPASISAMKAALMGPLSGIGDAIFWVAVRTIATSVALSLADGGSMFAPFAFVLVYHAFSMPSRMLLLRYGFNLGSTFLETAYESGYLELMTTATAMLGLMMVGAMAANFVSLNTQLVLSGSRNWESRVPLQDSLDAIFPKLLPLGVTFATLWATRKGIAAIWIILIMLVIGI